MLVGYVFYRRNLASPGKRSKALYSMLFSSIFFWSVLGTSLVLCTAMLDAYDVNPRFVVSMVFGGSILSSLAISGLMAFLARRFAVPRMLRGMTAGPLASSRLDGIFSALSARMDVRADLMEASVGNAFSVGNAGKNVVAVSPVIVESLSVEEAEAVLAHELSHLKNNDSLEKGLARMARLAFPFDPVLRLLEPAVHRERELLADLSSVKYTGRPLALASALIKVHSGPSTGLNGGGAGYFIGSGKRGLLSLYPDLQKRVEMLLDMARHMRPEQKVAVPA